VSSGKRASARRKWMAALAPVGAVALLIGVMASGALGSTVGSAAFTGGAGTVTVGGTVYAKQGGALTLTVNTSSDTKCVDVTGALAGRQTSSTAKSAWTFTFTAGAGDGLQTVTAAASPNFNANSCTGQSQSPQTASYVLDNTGPLLTGTLSPAPNAAGWNNSNVSVTWSATDGGSGVASGPTPASDSQTANTTGVTKTSTATDRLGNSGTGSITIKLDKNAPTITGSRAPAANANGWSNADVTVSFICSDSPSGIKSCAGPTTLSSSGANQSVTGNAVDNADNSASTTVGGINIDKAPPTLTGAPTTSPNAAGWYNGNVTIHWNASDGLSGLAGPPPADGTISGEGTGLTASASVSDKAGNTTTASSAPAVKIDKTPPNTIATAPTDWNNKDVTVSLGAADALSGVANTFYKVDGGAQQSGTSAEISHEGTHSLQFWSVDNADNIEAAHTVTVKIDKTPPTINHAFDPLANGNGWMNGDVKVTFSCADAGGSGIASCTAPQTVTTEGKDQAVTGTATDNAGNTATDPAKVSVDKTPPTITATADRAANAAGWYNADVAVSFACADALSGIDNCPAPKTVGDGADQAATGTATDAAGNTASDGVAHINVDETAPKLTGKPKTAPNADGWYSGDVVVDWSCDDALSGLARDCPASSTVNGEGSNLSASTSVADNAGNLTKATVDGVKIDRTAPVTLADVPAPLDSGWYAGPVKVTLKGVDSLSGVAQTYYTLDDGVATPYVGPFDVSSKGTHEIHFWSVDHAGNVEDESTPGHTLDLKIDGVPPRIDGQRAPAANSFGWNNTDVTATFTCGDDESGIKDCSGPVTLSKEGAGQSVDGTAHDNAGNSSQASVKDINIDKTAPTLVGAPTTDANAAGWYHDDVTIRWTATDDLSGIDPATQPADSFIKDEGANLTAAATVSDKAGNAAAATAGPIKIDRTAPTTTVDVSKPLVSGWYATPATVTLSGHDELSGVGTTFYSVDGGAAQTYDGTFDFSAKGVHTLTFWSVDKAGNVEDKTADGHTVTIKIDNLPPTITGGQTPAANVNGWNNGPVTVTFSCSDAESGIASCTGPTTLSDDGAGQSVDGTATDNGDNSAQATVKDINIDKTAPSLSGAPTTQANVAGWYRGDVTIHWTADDGLSGIDPATLPADTVVTGEGRGLTSEATVSDKAGNSTSATVDYVNIDRAAPKTTVDLSQAFESGWYAMAAKVTLSGHDDLSGVDKTFYSVDGGPAQTYDGTFDFSAKGVHTLTFWSVDKAGNVEDKTADGHTVTIKIDNVPPTITGTPKPAANANGWNNGPVTVSFDCNDAETGIAGCSDPVSLANEGANQSATGIATDTALNSAKTTIDGINIDRTPPTLSGQLPDPGGIDANGQKWYKADVPVTWICSDGLSGIDGGCPSTSTITGEGRRLTSEQLSVSDKAGNSSSASVGDVNIDREGPTISGAPTTKPNGAGWYKGLVNVRFQCDDPGLADGSLGSGVAACPSDIAMTNQGANVSVTSDPAKDVAGNSTRGITVPGINIDSTPPVSSDKASCMVVGGYCNGSAPVLVNIAATDPAPAGVTGVSGVKEIHYSTDNGTTWTTAPGDAVTVPLTLQASGKATISYYAVDKADNQEIVHTDSVDYDGTAPTVTHTLAPTANAAGWSSADTLVHFAATDDPGGSGVDASSVTADKTYSTETADQVITGSAADNAGNQGSDSFHFHLDKTAPTISAAVTPGSPDGSNGWYTHAVTVTFACSDPAAANGALGSGVAACPNPVTLSGNGANQSVTRSVADKADNTASKTVSGINIDMENPTLAIGGVKDGGIYTLGSVPAPTCNATDSFSGVASCKGSVTGGLANGVGTFTYTATATDKAGNAVTQSVTYKVVYNVPANVAFFLQPINDTAHTASSTLSVFKGGQTVPVKFQLKNAAGQVVQANSAPVWMVPAKGNATSSAVNEDAFSATGDSGSTFRWDSSAQQYIYNWNTASGQAGYYWKIGVKLDDGQTQYVDVGLR
jgi:hypothetical protein